MSRNPKILVRDSGAGIIGRRYVELAQDLTPGESAKFFPATWNPDDGWETDTSTAVEDLADTETLYDPLGGHRGRAYGKFDSPNQDGSRAVIERIGGLWIVQWMQPTALLIYGLLTADLASGTSTFLIDGVTVTPPGALITSEDPAGDITIRNKGFEGDNNGHCAALWDEANNEFMAFDVACPA